jgi:hypothetical protein
VVKVSPRSLPPPPLVKETPVPIARQVGWGPWAGLDGRGNSGPHWDLNRGPQQVVIPPELSRVAVAVTVVFSSVSSSSW